MLALEAPIKARLQVLPQLTGWDVRGATEHVDRGAVPAVDLRCIGATVGEKNSRTVKLEPVWSVRLVVKRSPSAADEISAAFDAVLEALHGFAPKNRAGRFWSPLEAAGVREVEFADAGLVGCELSFSTGATYKAAPSVP